MSLPNLIIPGAAKSGTSTLHAALAEHPQVFMSQKKEPHFFARSPSESGLASYLSLFEGTGEYPVRGESSTSYMVVPEAPRQIRKVLKDPKIIFIVRNPVAWAFSHYRWLCSLGLEYRPFRKAFNADRDEVPSIWNSVLNSGNFRYYHHTRLTARPCSASCAGSSGTGSSLSLSNGE